jgi:hypothetical protein
MVCCLRRHRASSLLRLDRIARHGSRQCADDPDVLLAAGLGLLEFLEQEARENPVKFCCHEAERHRDGVVVATE